MSLRCFCGSLFRSVEQLQQHVETLGHRFPCSCHRLFKMPAHLAHHQHDTGHSSMPDNRRALPVKSTTEPTRDNSCTICDRVFTTADGARQHLASKHPSCPSCYVHFSTRTQLDAHQMATRHCYCLEHDAMFDCKARFDRHQRRSNHNDGYECMDCDRAFRSQIALDDHLRSPGHNAVIQASSNRANADREAAAAEEANLRCEECDRTFKHQKAFQQHKDSVKHNPLSDMKCALSEHCNQVFTSPSALVFHLESGKCKSGMNRLKLNAVVHVHDSSRQITFAQNAKGVLSSASAAGSMPSVMELAASLSALGISSQRGAILTPTGTDANSDASNHPTPRHATVEESDDDIESVISTTGSTSGVPIYTPTHSRASSVVGGAILPPNQTNEWSFLQSKITPATPSVSSTDAEDIECDSETQLWPCPVSSCGKSFKSKQSLLLHMNSPAHAPNLFHCPTGVSLRGYKSTKSFKTLSGFAQHIEAGACVGGKDALKHIAGLFESSIRIATGRQVRLLTAAASST